MVRHLRITAGALGCLFIVAYQLQLLPFFSRLFVHERTIWPVIYYGCWALVILTTLSLSVMQRSLVKQCLPVLAVCLGTAALTFIHPVDQVAKNFLVGTAVIACGTVLAVASAPLALLRLAATVTVANAVICLLDIFFSHGFTNTVGRASGLSINANVAAAALFLGAASSFWTVPQRWRPAFVSIVGAGIFVTLSRSTLLAAVVVSGLVTLSLFWTGFKSGEARRPLQWVGVSVLLLALGGWIALALLVNDRFAVAATSSFRQIGTSVTALEEAREAVMRAAQAKSANPPEKAEPAKPAPKPSSEAKKSTTASDAAPPRSAQNAVPETPRPPIRDEAAETARSKTIISEIERRAENEGDINSISARGILMERAYLSYKIGPALGQGLGAAHALQPHNTFLLFAIAFGFIGWFVPLAFLALTAWWVRGVQQLPLLLATFTVMMTSHDVLFMPALLTPIFLGIAGLNGQRHADTAAPDTLPTLPYAAIAAPCLFAVGCMAIVSTTEFPFVPRLLLLLVLCALALWSIGVLRWRETIAGQPVVRGG